MRTLGIEFAGRDMLYVVLDSHSGTNEISSTSRLVLTETRSRSALNAFQKAVTTLFNEAAADVVAIKLKPENGMRAAGAAALKMEGIVLANCPCDVDFVSGQRCNATALPPSTLFAYLTNAYRTALAAAS